MSDGYPARAVQEHTDLLAETRRQQAEIERLRADRDVLATVLRQVVSEMSAVTEVARRCGVAPTRLHELLAHAGGGE